MRDVQPREIQYYRTSDGQRPFIEWLESIRNTNTQARIQARLERLEDGNFGDCQSVGDGGF
jgi:putative addiction module killer protein